MYVLKTRLWQDTTFLSPEAACKQVEQRKAFCCPAGTAHLTVEAIKGLRSTLLFIVPSGRLLGRRSGLTDLSVLDTNIGERMRLTTRSSGWVLLSVDIVLRNFERHGLSVISSLPASNALASQLFTPELQVPSAAMGGSPLYPYSASSNPGGPPSLVQRRGLAHSSSSVSYKTAESERGPVDAITTQQLFEKQGSNLGKKTV